ncbi:hypothetical protein Tdes44962_MAKER05756 [Teratosphaeria destructans]|uniref:Uncharacterized protein n=1 Tax=Teratosphaeria destructans TaxID=418781 RepID=A0A9W7SJ39_9PEZI|nr:hypothetical protein Tdes44962_MAKER05756 [Teratosphaeria destructans]
MSPRTVCQGIWDFVGCKETHYGVYPASKSQVHFPLLSGDLPTSHPLQQFWSSPEQQASVYSRVLDTGLVPQEGVSVCTRKLQNGQSAPCFSVDVNGAPSVFETTAKMLWQHVKSTCKSLDSGFIVEVNDTHRLSDYTVYPQADRTDSTNRCLVDRRQNLTTAFIAQVRNLYPEYVETNVAPNVQACLMRKPHTGPTTVAIGTRRVSPALLLERGFVEHTVCVQFYGDAEGDFGALKEKLEETLASLKGQKGHTGIEMQVRIAEWG